jgi:hypothetical protein
MGKGWKGERQKHSASARGIKTSNTGYKEPKIKVYRGKVMVTHLRADNDPNGNPQRLYVINDMKGAVIDVIDEGYYGSQAYRRKYPNFVEVSTYYIPKSQYHELKREWKDK